MSSCFPKSYSISLNFTRKFFHLFSWINSYIVFFFVLSFCFHFIFNLLSGISFLITSQPFIFTAVETISWCGHFVSQDSAFSNKRKTNKSRTTIQLRCITPRYVFQGTSVNITQIFIKRQKMEPF